MRKKKPALKKAAGLIVGFKEKVTEIKDQVEALREEQKKNHMMGVLQASSSSSKKTYVDISVSSVVKASVAIVLVVGAVYILYLIQDVLGLLFVSFLLAAALNPFVDYLHKYKIPRSLGILLSYFLIVVVITIVILALIPMLVEQGNDLIQSMITYFQGIAQEGVTDIPVPFMPDGMKQSLITYFNEVRENFNLDLVFNEIIQWLDTNQEAITSNLQKVGTNFFGVLSAVANGLGNVILMLLLTFFIVVEKVEIKKFALAVLPKKYKNYFTTKVGAIQHKIGAWVRGQLLLGLAIGISTYIGFWILHIFGIEIPYKETLSIIAAITELIPVVGPILAAIFAILVAANVGTAHVVAVLILFILIQQVENNILVPIIMRHAVGLSPIVIIVGMIIGVKFYGFIGLVLAIPITTIIALFVNDLALKQGKIK